MRFELRTILGVTSVVALCAALPHLVGVPLHTGWGTLILLMSIVGGAIGAAFGGKPGALVGGAAGFVSVLAMIGLIILGVMMSAIP